MIQRNFPAPAWLDLKMFAPQPALERAALGPNRGGIPESSEILIQPVGWAEASRRCQSRYSQDLRDRVIDAVEEGRNEPPRSSRVGTRSADLWLSNGLSELNGTAHESLSDMAAHRASKLMPHRAFLEAARAEKSDVTLQALCESPFGRARGQSRHLDDEPLLLPPDPASRSKKDPCPHASRIART